MEDEKDEIKEAKKEDMLSDEERREILERELNFSCDTAAVKLRRGFNPLRSIYDFFLNQLPF